MARRNLTVLAISLILASACGEQEIGAEAPSTAKRFAVLCVVAALRW